MKKSKTTTVQISCKDPDAFGEMSEALGLSESKRDRFLEFGEYAMIEIVVDSNLKIISGRFLPI